MHRNRSGHDQIQTKFVIALYKSILGDREILTFFLGFIRYSNFIIFFFLYLYAS